MSSWYSFFSSFRLSLKASVTNPVSGVHGSGLRRILRGISKRSNWAKKEKKEEKHWNKTLYLQVKSDFSHLLEQLRWGSWGPAPPWLYCCTAPPMSLWYCTVQPEPAAASDWAPRSQSRTSHHYRAREGWGQTLACRSENVPNLEFLKFWDYWDLIWNESQRL